MKKLSIVVLVLLFGSIVWLARPTAKTSSDIAVESSYDFGTISMAQGNVTHDFTFSNTSDKPVRLVKIATSCMCTTARFILNGKTYGPFGMEGMGGSTGADITLNPGDRAMVQAIYDPNAHGPAGVGTIDRTIMLDDANGGMTQFEIKANVTP